MIRQLTFMWNGFKINSLHLFHSFIKKIHGYMPSTLQKITTRSSYWIHGIHQGDPMTLKMSLAHRVVGPQEPLEVAYYHLAYRAASATSTIREPPSPALTGIASPAASTSTSPTLAHHSTLPQSPSNDTWLAWLIVLQSDGQVSST